MSEHFSQLFSQFLRRVEDQFRLKHFLQKVIVAPVVGIEVLAADDLEYTAKPLGTGALPYGKERIVETQMAEVFVEKKNLRNTVGKVLQVFVQERPEVDRFLVYCRNLVTPQGISDTGGRRTAPSAGALYPLEVCVVAGNVTGLSVGIYSYDPHKHELSRTLDRDKRVELSKAALGQSSIKNAAAVLVISAVYERVTVKYGERGIRYLHMEAGHAAQNVFLDLGTVVIGAFHDEQVRAVLHLPGQVQPLYLMPVGKK